MMMAMMTMPRQKCLSSVMVEQPVIPFSKILQK
jgi:hypothetical protein